MAVLLLPAAASALTAGASAFVQIAAAAVATAAGGYIDNLLFGPKLEDQQGPRLDSLQVQASTEGAPIPEIAGRVRIAGQIIWATNFKEVATTEKQGGKGGGGGSAKTTTYAYFANFAVGRPHLGGREAAFARRHHHAGLSRRRRPIARSSD
jgi:hypothetical protein